MNTALTNMARRLHRRLGRYLEERGRTPAPDREAQVTVLHDEHHHGRHRGGGRPMDRAMDAEAFASLLAGLGYANPMEPLFMLEAFLSAGTHLTAPEFTKYLKNRGRDVSTEKAAGALELFTSLGLAEKSHAKDGQIIYEHTHPGLHHDHIICSGCGRATEFNRPDVDGLIEKIAGDEDYSHLHHKLTIYGLCPECRRRRWEGLPLAETAVGENVMVVGFTGSDAVKTRLGDMGLRRGARLRILGEQSGSMIVLFDGCRLAMGPEMSEGILVRSVEHGFRGRSCGSRPDSSSQTGSK